MRGLTSLIVLGLFAAACSEAPAETTAAPTTFAPTTTSMATTTTVSPPPTSTTEVPDFPAAALFLTAVDEALAGTSYEGAAVQDPEAFLSMAAVFCDLLDDELSLEEVLDAYTAALIEGSAEGGTVEADDLLLGGVIVGAGIRLICPQHLDELDDLPAPTTPTTTSP